jgi:hypothetical protein
VIKQLRKQHGKSREQLWTEQENKPSNIKMNIRWRNSLKATLCLIERSNMEATTLPLVGRERLQRLLMPFKGGGDDGGDGGWVGGWGRAKGLLWFISHGGNTAEQYFSRKKERSYICIPSWLHVYSTTKTESMIVFGINDVVEMLAMPLALCSSSWHAVQERVLTTNLHVKRPYA